MLKLVSTMNYIGLAFIRFENEQITILEPEKESQHYCGGNGRAGKDVFVCP